MANERITERLVRRHFEQFEELIIIEEQASEKPALANLLRRASKAGTQAHGFPEFLIQFDQTENLVAVIECKTNARFHESREHDRPVHYAVDGALHYARYLSKKFDVLAIAVSGTNERTLEVSHFIQLKGQTTYRNLNINELLEPGDYLKTYYDTPEKFRQDYDSLRVYMKDLNERLHKYDVPEWRRAVLISMVLIALKHLPFKNSYSLNNKPRSLAESVVKSALDELEAAGIKKDKLEILRNEFTFVLSTPVLSREKHIFRDIIKETDDEINNFVETHKYRDVLGDLYIEFLRYANSDKDLGIVLTPPHITELFSDLAEVSPSSVVYDNCAGSGGFLISAMRKMIRQVGNTRKGENKIKEAGIIGTEKQPHIYSLAVSNMFIHQDGKSNFQGDSCFDPNLIRLVKSRKPTIGFLNPPYKSSKTQGQDKEELDFVANNLDCLVEGGICIAIVPMSSALAKRGHAADWKKYLMRNHTLEAVMSMPDELFHNSNVSVVTCVMIFRAHKKHQKNKKVFLGYFKNDGFVRRRIGGRCDDLGKWDSIKDHWINLYMNRLEQPGLSVCVELAPDEEWAAERFIETDYSRVGDTVFEDTVWRHDILDS